MINESAALKESRRCASHGCWGVLKATAHLRCPREQQVSSRNQARPLSPSMGARWLEVDLLPGLWLA